jgi:hypothetical protein
MYTAHNDSTVDGETRVSRMEEEGGEAGKERRQTTALKSHRVLLFFSFFLYYFNSECEDWGKIELREELKVRDTHSSKLFLRRKKKKAFV